MYAIIYDMLIRGTLPLGKFYKFYTEQMIIVSVATI